MADRQWEMQSAVGPIYLVASSKGLKGVLWERQNVPFLESKDESSNMANILSTTVNQLSEYFEGRRKEFDIPLDVEGTEFQKKVWDQLCQISYGKTKAYKDIAVALKNHKACRAVGTANGQNPISIIIPCHRVIASNGTLGGYAGGLETKKKLLNLESMLELEH